MTELRKEKLLKVLSKRQDNLTIVFENVEDPHNISAVLRTCESIGVQEIYILNHSIAPHPKFGKTLGTRSSSSAYKWLSIYYFDQVDDCIQHLHQQGFLIMSTSLTEAAVDLYEMDFTQKIALVFGNERKGVSKQLLALSDGNFLIPQVGIIQSLNISVACAISLYEAFRQKMLAGHYDQMSLPQSKLSALKADWGLSEY